MPPLNLFQSVLSSFLLQKKIKTNYTFIFSNIFINKHLIFINIHTRTNVIFTAIETARSE